MGELTSVSGQCLCGAVSINATAPIKEAGACHCKMCRTWGGGPFIGIDCGSTVQFTGEDHIAAFDSSEWAERGFCKGCGTHLFYRLKQQQQYIVPAGLFAQDDTFSMDHQVFIDHKPDLYAFTGDTKNMTGEEAFAFFGAQQP